MKKNLGQTERLIRMMLGIIFGAIYLGGFLTGTWGLVLFIVGIVFMLTSIVSFCPIYAILGIDSRGLKHRKA